MTRGFPPARPPARPVLALAVLAGLTLAAGPLRADDSDPLWPCAQRYVPTLSATTMWDGPPLEGADAGIEPARVQQVNALAGELLAGRGDAPEQRIAAFAATAPDDALRNRLLTLLFATLLDRTNEERHVMMEGIRKQAAGVNALADRMNELLAKRGQLPADEQNGPSPEAADLDKELYWMQRLFNERRRAQTYLCEAPVLREQRLGVLARAILAELH